MTRRHVRCRKSSPLVLATTPLIALSSLLCLLGSSARGNAQARLIPGQSAAGVLKPGESRDYLLSLKEGQYAAIRYPAGIDLQVLTLNGTPVNGVMELGGDPREVGGDDVLSFTAERTATYKLRVQNGSDEKDVAIQRAEKVLGVKHSKPRSLPFRLSYTSNFVLPSGLRLTQTEKINDYAIRIYKAHGEQDGAFVILRDGQRVYAKVGHGDFSFQVLSDEDDKASADLVKPGRDITGSGSPGLMIGEYTGGAHCCFVLYPFELGQTFHIIRSLNIGEGEGIGVRRLGANKGLAILTYDDTFAYWHTSFAESPMPDVILSYRDGAYRPDYELMRKPAPSWDELSTASQKDRAALEKTANEPYSPEEDLPPFWGRMLDLIYTGHEDLAWKYFDEAWPPSKPGQALFVKDFKKQLSESRYWSQRAKG